MDMPRTCHGYAGDMPDICRGYAKDILGIGWVCDHNMPRIYPRYAQNMPEKSPGMPNILSRYSKDLP